MGRKVRLITIPDSDCGCSTVGRIGPESFDPPPFGKPLPDNGIIIWYDDPAFAIKAAEILFADDEPINGEKDK